MAVHIHLDNGGGGDAPDLSQYQKKLVAGENITIDPETNTISAAGGGGGKEYTAGDGISIDPETNTISAEKQLKYVNEPDWYKAVIIGGEEAGNRYGNGGGTGIGCLVEGRNNDAALSTCVHVEGKGNYATGMGSHTEGTNNLNCGNFSHVEGNCHIVRGKFMHVFGKNSTPNVHIGGKSGLTFDDTTPEPSDTYYDYVEIVGNGANGSSQARSNARELRWNGKEWLADTLEVSRDPQTPLEVATMQYVESRCSNVYEYAAAGIKSILPQLPYMIELDLRSVVAQYKAGGKVVSGLNQNVLSEIVRDDIIFDGIGLEALLSAPKPVVLHLTTRFTVVHDTVQDTLTVRVDDEANGVYLNVNSVRVDPKGYIALTAGLPKTTGFAGLPQQFRAGGMLCIEVTPQGQWYRIVTDDYGWLETNA